MLGPGPGQLVQTADGRLVALGPGNTFYEVGIPANSHIQVRRDKTITDKLMLYIHNDDKQNCPFCRLKLVVEKFKHST